MMVTALAKLKHDLAAGGLNDLPPLFLRFVKICEAARLMNLCKLRQLIPAAIFHFNILSGALAPLTEFMLKNRKSLIY
ncbi:MAG TPA: hypothetical protein VM577_08060 [Anaerovoracaceae bacterium]|nr:hypothetical protein [Anaerovoracaceae bacterium]